MRGATWPMALTALPLLVGAALVAWNVVLAGWISTHRESGRAFSGLTALCGLLVAPALVVAVATGAEGGARTVLGIAWLWPAVAVAFVVQAVLALLGRRLSPVVGLPILLYDVAVAVAAAGDGWVAMRGSAPEWLQGAVAARDAVVGVTAGRAALASPLALLVPLLAPDRAARWRATAAVRGALVLAATALATVFALEWPRGVGAVRSYADALAMPAQARDPSGFAIGLRLLPTLHGAPSGRAARADLRLADTVRPGIALLVLAADAADPASLDSLDRVLAPLREDGVTVAVALAVGAVPGAPTAPARRRALDAILRRLRPDVLFPAWLPAVPPVTPHVAPDVAWWRAALRDGADLARTVRPRTRVAWSAARMDATDSAVYAWAAGTESPVSLLAFAAWPSFAGRPGVEARLRAMDRWQARAATQGAPARPHWIATAGGFPHAHGDASQVATVRAVLGWATRRPWVAAVVVGEPADYDGRVGLRAASGRDRPVVGVLARFSELLRGDDSP